MKRRQFTILALGIVAARLLHAQSVIRIGSRRLAALREPEDNCPGTMTWGGMATLCDMIAEQVEDDKPNSPNKYLYQSTMFEVAGVDPRRDAPETIRKKMQHFWLYFEDKLFCDSLTFNVPGGSIVKFAVAKRSDDFVRDVAAWGVPLNKIDAHDRATVLDYLGDELRRAKGSPLETRLNRYYKSLRATGARHRAEIESGQVPPFVDPYQAEIAPLLRRYDRACYYSAGLAAVKKGNKWGYADESGALRIPHRYDGAFNFSEGRATVVEDGRWGYLDSTGEVAIPFRYQDARVFSKGRALVSIDGRSWTSVDRSGQPVS